MSASPNRSIISVLFAFFALFAVMTVKSASAQDFGTYGFEVDAPCALTKDKELSPRQAAQLGYTGIRTWITFSCVVAGAGDGVGTLYRVTFIRHDVDVNMDLESYAKGVCDNKAKQGMETELSAYKGRPACSSRDQAYIRNKIFESQMSDFAVGKTSFTLQVLTSDGPPSQHMSVLKKGFQTR